MSSKKNSIPVFSLKTILLPVVQALKEILLIFISHSFIYQVVSHDFGGSKRSLHIQYVIMFPISSVPLQCKRLWNRWHTLIAKLNCHLPKHRA